MRAALRCIAPRALSTRAALSFNTRSAHTSVAACPSLSTHSLSILSPSVRASGNGRGPWLEADNASEENTTTTTTTHQQRPQFALQQPMESASSSTAVNAATQEQERQARVWRNLMVEAVLTEVVEPIEHWANLAQEAKIELNSEAFDAMASMYVALGRLDLADSLWEIMSEKSITPDVHFCTRMIRVWGRRRNVTEVDRWTARTQRAGYLECDGVQHACVVAWGDCGEVDRVFAWAEARSTPIPAAFVRAFLIALGKNGKTEQFQDFCHGIFTSWAEEESEVPVVPRLVNLDVASAVIRYHPDTTIVRNIFNSTQTRVARASVAFSQTSATTNAVEMKRVQAARKDSAEVMSAMMSRCLAERRYAETLEILDTVLRLDLPVTPSLCAEVMRMHASIGNVDGTEGVWRDMVHHGILPEADIFVAALQEYGKRKNIREVDQWVERASQQGFDKHPEVQRSFIGAWAHCGHPERLLQWASRKQ